MGKMQGKVAIISGANTRIVRETAKVKLLAEYLKAALLLNRDCPIQQLSESCDYFLFPETARSTS